MISQLPIICDSGTGYIKIGYAGETFPQYSIPAMIGRPMLRYNLKIDDVQLKEIMIGDEAAPYQSMLELSKPVEEGTVKNWDDMELLWDYSFKKIGAETQGNTVLMTEAVMNPDSNRKKMMEILFEKFQFGKAQVGVQALLSLYCEGLTTGMLLDSGDGVTHCIPVYENYVLTHNVKRMNIAGRHMTQFLIKLLLKRGYAFNSTADFELVREIKEKLCYVSGDVRVDRKLADETVALEKQYKLPDNTYIKLGRERYEAAELLFNPSIDGHSFEGVSNLVYDTIQKCEIDIKQEMFANILISGGTTMFPGFPTRLQSDIISLFKTNVLKDRTYKDSKIKIKIIDPPMRKYNVFIGGGVLARKMMDVEQFWVTKNDYDELGKDRVIHKLQSAGMF